MIDPPRLRDSGNAFCRTLLQASDDDDKNANRALTRTALLLGVTTAAAVSSVASTAAGSVAAKASAPATGAAWLWLLKWFGIGALGGVTVIAGGTQVLRSSPPTPAASLETPAAQRRPLRASSPGPARTPVASASIQESPAATPSTGVPAIALGPEQNARPEAPGLLPSMDLAPVQEPKDDNSKGALLDAGVDKTAALAADVALVDGARSAVAAGQAAEALRWLDRYDREKHTSVLDPEAALLRIESSSRLGRAQAAKDLADRFVRAYPNSPHAPRLREAHGLSAPTSPQR